MPSKSDRLNAALSGRYRIEQELGTVGMATVYLAEDLKHDRKVAVKVLRPELAAVLGAERFVAEIKREPVDRSMFNQPTAHNQQRSGKRADSRQLPVFSDRARSRRFVRWMIRHA